MRSTDATLKAYLAANTSFPFRADLYKVTLLDGTIYRWTSWDSNLIVGGNTFLSAGPAAPMVKRSRFKQSARLSIDTLDLTLFVQAGNINFPLIAIDGYFDGARVQVDHLIMPTPGDVTTLVPITSFFEGRVAAVDPTPPSVTLRLKSELESLNILLPKFLLQPSCGNAVYDANCGLVRATFTDSGTASGVPTTTTVPTTTAAIIARPTGNYELGVLKFTSGALNGTRRAVKTSVLSGGTTTFTLALPFASAAVAGDTFTVYPGCKRTRAYCANSNAALGPAFNNLAQYRGFPLVPTPESGQ